MKAIQVDPSCGADGIAGEPATIGLDRNTGSDNTLGPSPYPYDTPNGRCNRTGGVRC